MERINLNYSLKNIPVPTKSSYQLKLIDKNESVIKRMRWKTLFFLRDNSDTNNNNNDISENEKRPLVLKQKNNQHRLTNCKVLKKIN